MRTFTRYLIVLFVISLFLLHNVYIAGIPVPMIIGVVVLVMLFTSSVTPKKIQYPISKTNIIRYVFFLLAMTLTMYISGTITLEYIKLLIGYHFMGIIVFFAIAKFVDNEKDVRAIVNILVLILIADVLVTALQMLNIGIGWEIGSYFSTDEALMKYQDRVERKESFLGVSALMGMMGSGINNGYILGSLPVLILPLMKRKKLLGGILLAIAYVACFFCQQRAAFFLLTFSLLLISFRLDRSGFFKLLYILLFLIIIIFSDYFFSLDMGRLLNFEDDVRESLYDGSIEFIRNNIFSGGSEKFIELNGTLPHNLIFNSFIFAGLIGGIIAIVIFVSMSIQSVKVIAKTSKISYAACLGFSILIFYGIAMTHNPSFITGDEKIWIFYALFLKSRMMRI